MASSAPRPAARASTRLATLTQTMPRTSTITAIRPPSITLSGCMNSGWSAVARIDRHRRLLTGRLPGIQSKLPPDGVEVGLRLREIDAGLQPPNQGCAAVQALRLDRASAGAAHRRRTAPTESAVSGVIRPANRSGATPTTVNAVPFSTIVRPTTSSGPAQSGSSRSACESTTTGGAPGRSSVSASRRPRDGRQAEQRKVVAGDDLAERRLDVAVDAQAERSDLERGQTGQGRIAIPQGEIGRVRVFEKRLE